jgi:hypothetical protein
MSEPEDDDDLDGTKYGEECAKRRRAWKGKKRRVLIGQIGPDNGEEPHDLPIAFVFQKGVENKWPLKARILMGEDMVTMHYRVETWRHCALYPNDVQPRNTVAVMHLSRETTDHLGGYFNVMVEDVRGPVFLEQLAELWPYIDFPTASSIWEPDMLDAEIDEIMAWARENCPGVVVHMIERKPNGKYVHVLAFQDPHAHFHASMKFQGGGWKPEFMQNET